MNNEFLVDENVRPQDDFYGHVNNIWLKENPIPDSESKWGVFVWLREENWKKLDDILREMSQQVGQVGLIKQLSDIYTSAQDAGKVATTGAQELQNWFTEIDKISTAEDLQDFLFKSHGYDLGLLWNWYVDLDNKDSTKYAFYIHQGGLSLPDRDYYTKVDEHMQRCREALVPHIEKMLAFAGIANPGVAAKQIFELEKKLAESSWTSTELRDVERMYNPHSLKELKENFPAIDWEKYLVGLGVKEKYLIVDTPSFFTAVNALLGEVAFDVWRSYLKWHTLRKLNSGLGEEYAQAQFEFYGKILGGTKELQPRWKRIVLVMESLVGEGMGQFYVERFFPAEAKNRMEELVKDLKRAFYKRLEEASWMAPETKAHALEKLTKMKIKVGYPVKWRDYAKLATQPESFVENILVASKFEGERNLAKLGTGVDKEEWVCTPQTVNAFAYFNLNEIIFPAGILQPPYFDLHGTNAQNFGAIGTVIGHEITHGFDDRGCLFDAEGNMRNWRTEEDAERFKYMTNGLVEVANAYEVLPGRFINGELTLGENTADFGGVEIALDALEIYEGRELQKAELQDFFMAMARVWAESIRPERALELLTTDPHSPEKFRTNVVLGHNDRFALAFELKEGDGLYVKPEKRIKIW